MVNFFSKISGQNCDEFWNKIYYYILRFHRKKPVKIKFFTKKWWPPELLVKVNSPQSPIIREFLTLLLRLKIYSCSEITIQFSVSKFFEY